MNGFVYIFFLFLLILLLHILYLLVSAIENMFFTLRITFSNSNQQNEIIKFLEKYHIKYKKIYYSHNGKGEIIAEKGLLSVIMQIIKYLRLSRFFKDSHTIGNAYFQIEHGINNITITNKITDKKITNINNRDEIWDFVINNLSEFFNENQLICKLAEFGYITDKQSIILSTSKTLNINNIMRNTYCSGNYERNKRKVFDINNCTIEQLDALPGITLIIAKKLIKYRDDNGCFDTVSDFWTVSGLSFHQRIKIERMVILKAKKVKKIKSVETFVDKIEMLCERIVDI